MDLTELLDEMSIATLLVASLIITLFSMEIGFRVGRRRRRRVAAEEKVDAGPLVAAALSLLAFMLAMVFSTVQSRFHELKQVALDEANAIGTAYLRADLLPTADRVEIRRLLSDYVTLRIDAVEAGTPRQLQQAIDRSEELQSVLWSRAATHADQHPTPVSALFVQAVNDVIDLHETRVTVGIHYRLPGIIWSVLFGLAIVALGMGGYASALSSSRRLIAVGLSAALAFSVVLLLVVALDRPHKHLSTATQEAMLDLQESIRSTESQP